MKITITLEDGKNGLTAKMSTVRKSSTKKQRQNSVAWHSALFSMKHLKSLMEETGCAVDAEVRGDGKVIHTEHTPES